MTNEERPLSEGQSTRRSQRRIAPTNISTTPQYASPQRNPYPFQSTDGGNIDDAMSDYGDDDQPAQDTRPHEERDLVRLAHSFWERRSNDGASPILKVCNVWVYPRQNDGQAKTEDSKIHNPKIRAIESMSIDGLRRNYSRMSSMGSLTSHTNNESERSGLEDADNVGPASSLDVQSHFGDEWRKQFPNQLVPPLLPMPAIGQRSQHHANFVMEYLNSGDSSSDNLGLSTPASTTKSTPGESIDGDELAISPDIRASFEDEKYDSDPHGIYNASPPPRRRKAEEENANQINQEAQPHAIQAEHDLTQDPDETEEYISTPSRHSDESEGANCIEEGSVSRGRPSKKTKTKKRSKTGSTRRKKRSSSRR